MEKWKPKKDTSKVAFVYHIDEGSSLNSGHIGLYTELEANGKPIKSVNLDYGVWTYGGDEYEYGLLWDGVPEGEIKRRFPFCEYVQIFCATGGEMKGYAGGVVNRELFIDPLHPEKGYNFTPLLRVCENIVRQGVKPYLKLGHVPIAFSDDYKRSVPFRTNLRPPTDWQHYYQYLCDVMAALAERFGVEELRTWMWGSFTEFDNLEWLSAEDGENKEAVNLNAACKLYQCTVAAVEAVLGEGQADIGPHFCQSSDPGWLSAPEMIERCLTEVNPFTGKTGTTVSRLSLSFYMVYCGWERSRQDYLKRFQPVMEKYGITRLVFDEGNMMRGEDGLNLVTTTYAAQSWAIARQALDYKDALDNGWERFFVWGFTTNGCINWSGMFNCANLVGPCHGFVNLYKLIARMYGGLRQPVAKGGLLSNKGDVVDAVAVYQPEEKKLQVLVFNYNADFYAKTTENFTLRVVCGANGRPGTAKRWQLDEEHGEFWKIWWEERGKNATYKQSVFDGCLPAALRKEEDKQFWLENEARYEQLGQLPEPTEHAVQWDGCTLVIDDTVTHHGVLYYEVEGVEAFHTADWEG